MVLTKRLVVPEAEELIDIVDKNDEDIAPKDFVPYSPLLAAMEISPYQLK